MTHSVPVSEKKITQVQQKVLAHQSKTATVHVPLMTPVLEPMTTTAHVPEITSLHILENVSSSHQTHVCTSESLPITSQPLVTRNKGSMTTTRQVPAFGVASSYSAQVSPPNPLSN